MTTHFNITSDSVDTLEERQKVFFANCRKMKGPERDEEYEKIKKEYNKVIMSDQNWLKLDLHEPRDGWYKPWIKVHVTKVSFAPTEKAVIGNS